jgi:hypothetical protein
MPEDSFTGLDFMKTLRSIYPEVWEKLVKRFRLFWSKRRYTLATHLSNRLDMCSHKSYSILVAFTNYNAKAGSRITEKLCRTKGDISEVHG